MVELQGTLETRPHRDHVLDAMPFGQLSFETTQRKKRKVSLLNPSGDQTGVERVELMIGRQLLEGRREKLKHPMTVVRKVATPNISTSGAISTTGGTDVVYEIVGICRHRLLFTSRPEPLSPNVSPTGSPIKGSSLNLSTSPIRESFFQSFKKKVAEKNVKLQSSSNNSNRSKKGNEKPKVVDFFALHSRKKGKK